jgi:predicted nucleic acid-binding Zn ribbon protein
MPIYSYRCPLCNSAKEVIHGINDTLEIRCVNEQHRGRICNALMERELSLSSFRLYGNDWYKPSRKD